MPLTKEDFLMHPEFGAMPEGMATVVQVCCGFSKSDCDGNCEVADSNLKHLTEITLTDADLSVLTMGQAPYGGSI